MTLLVGKEEQKFAVHKEILRAHSPFFRSAVQQNWKEGQEGIIRLPDDDPEVLELYEEWLYEGKIFSQDEQQVEDSDESDLLIKAFVFGEKIQDGRFRDAAIDCLIACLNSKDENRYKWFPTEQGIDMVYEGTPPGSPLRRLMVDMHVYYGEESWFDGETNTEFLVELARDLLNVRQELDLNEPACGTSCSYHHHSHDKYCYSNDPEH